MGIFVFIMALGLIGPSILSIFDNNIQNLPSAGSPETTSKNQQNLNYPASTTSSTVQ